MSSYEVSLSMVLCNFPHQSPHPLYATPEPPKWRPFLKVGGFFHTPIPFFHGNFFLVGSIGPLRPPPPTFCHHIALNIIDRLLCSSVRFSPLLQLPLTFFIVSPPKTSPVCSRWCDQSFHKRTLIFFLLPVSMVSSVTPLLFFATTCTVVHSQV